MSGLSQAIDLLKATFDKYAGKEGDKNTLTKRELSELLRSELPSGGSVGKSAESNFFSMLDDDGDGVVNFTEYINLVAAFTVLNHQK
ncbi:ictacalcin-like [Anabas testudineus]|uniref:Protein S100 n=1 Tax=Anabas testudineus TaxID=64144 RepID=A0A3Q1JU00_ANATE|nr:ictacalcin-like [Anabas testudineus]